jgi:phosphoglycerate kinase
MLSNKLSLEQVEFSGKRVLLRVDFNVPLKNGVVQDDTRITAALPTIKYILDKSPKYLLVMSHLGRPNGSVNPKYSLEPVANHFEKLLGKNVIFATEDNVSELAQAAEEGAVILLENLRFNLAEEGKGEKNKQKVKATKEEIAAFRAFLTSLGDVYVNDAFGCAHRAHSSMVGIELPIKASGYLLKKELDYFAKAIESPAHPFLAILGGAKVADKIQLVENLIQKVDHLWIGGGMGFTFKKMVDNMKIGSSIFDEEGSKLIEKIMKKAEEHKVQIHLPSDFIIADAFPAGDKEVKVDYADGDIPDGWMGLDQGNKSDEALGKLILECKTIVWNGPLGVFENPKFETGTKNAFSNLVTATQNGAISIIGGGDTASAAAKWNFNDSVSHVSTGGGASLELLEGKLLPGVLALSDK